MKAPAIHRRRRAPMSEQQRLQCLAAIDKALGCNFPPGYVAQIDWRCGARRKQVAKEARAEMARTGRGWGNGTIESLTRPGFLPGALPMMRQRFGGAR